MRRLLFILIIFFSAIAPSLSTGVLSAQTNTSEIVINEIQTGGLDELLLEDGKQEFIEIYNKSTEPILLAGWKLQYFSATRLDVFDVNASPTRELFSLAGTVTTKGSIVLSYEGFMSNADGFFGQGSTASSGMMARSGGHVRLVSSEGQISDVVGWGTAKSPETKALAEIGVGSSVERKKIETVVVDTNNNFDDFSILSTPSPQSGGLVIEIPPIEPEPIIPPCDGLVISELMPNPDGTDTGHEFIELYNPTDLSIYLEDCVLVTTATSQQYLFAIGSLMQPKQYLAFYDNQTGLTLANAAGGSVTLIGTEADHTITYPADMGANHSWSLIGGLWHDSTVPSPNAINALPLPEVLGATDEEVTLEPCGPGKYRSPDTNRCRNTLTTSGVLALCGPGQTRNPDTNRCRSAASLAARLIPCSEGQERNPETNRCRKIASAIQTACQEGYERNAETNRCRKVAATLAASPSVGDPSTASPKRLNYAFFSVMSILVAGYGVFEYRRDISTVLTKLQAKRFTKIAAK